jgi:hypothetical protein
MTLHHLRTRGPGLPPHLPPDALRAPFPANSVLTADAANILAITRRNLQESWRAVSAARMALAEGRARG